MNISKLVSIAIFSVSSIFGYTQDTIKAKNAEAILYLGKGEKQPLIVGLGGSEGGNVWTKDYWKKTRDEFTERGYAFLAIGYFGCRNTPEILDKIAIDAIYNAIAEASKNKRINKKKIAVIGGSRGADLALLLGTYYKDITCIVGMSTSHAVFPGHTQEFNSSCWTFKGKELPYVPVNEEAVPFLMKRDLRGTFEAMLKDTIAEQKALIKVEKINGPILLLSATKDEIIPAVEMGNKITARLKEYNFKYPYKHLVLEGTHTEPTQHFDEIFSFLNNNFIKK
ncbi:acyl-CoA thioester hydrolase/BAAT C-terminal domain-containing protein [Flavobacterium piscis]|uniref:Esterase/lipase n=1 Tax=Flavobacterium piscis TaxID=1114874 RepID=A0ABU1YD42_9FLAO|nr:acyl-CoA thioester hydrolase/BAAT C-terminal domain-containing protein [Flavobacterium piscis]MDR7212168.1 esterase/lipase [Flavobacterium piscis]